MGQKAIEIVENSGLSLKELVEKLQRAYCDECLSYIQYWEGARIATGLIRESAVKEMQEHSGEELEHANLLAQRIMELGATPLVGPQQWLENSTCGYEAPLEDDIRTLLEQNILSERCAIEVYRQLADFTHGKDDITYKLAVKILAEEVEHEHDLETLRNDIAMGL